MTNPVAPIGDPIELPSWLHDCDLTPTVYRNGRPNVGGNGQELVTSGTCRNTRGNTMSMAGYGTMAQRSNDTTEVAMIDLTKDLFGYSVAPDGNNKDVIIGNFWHVAQEVLSQRYYIMLLQRYRKDGHYTGMSYAKIGDMNNITASRTRDIIQNALRKMRHPAAQNLYLHQVCPHCGRPYDNPPK